MFSIDDSFDVEDEAFLEVINIGKEKDQSNKETNFKRKSFQMGKSGFGETTLPNTSKSSSDPLSLNNSLLNKPALLYMRNNNKSFVSEKEKEKVKLNGFESPTFPMIPSDSKIKKFHFRASPQTSPSENVSFLSSSASSCTKHTSRSSPVNLADEFDTTTEENPRKHPDDDCSLQLIDNNVLLEISQDSWDSDVDLSLSNTPKWKPATKGQIQPSVAKNVISNTISSYHNHTNLEDNCAEFIFEPQMGEACPSDIHSGVLQPGMYYDTSREMLSSCDKFPESIKIPNIYTNYTNPHSPKRTMSENEGSRRSLQCDNVFKTPVNRSVSRTIRHVSESPMQCTNKPQTIDHLFGLDSPMIDTPPSNKPSSMKRKRKFPGPAGALPRLKPNVSLQDLENTTVTSPKIQLKKLPAVTDSQITSSQSCEEKFLDIPWQMMKHDLEPQAQLILEEFSIQNIVKKASKKTLPRGKVPVMCVLIDQISVENAEASTILKDPSGEMKGTIHRDVVKEHAMEMQPGTVLVLRQVGVFSPSSARNHYLNITPNNLVRLYTRTDTTGVEAKTIAKFENDDFKIPVVPSPMIKSSRAMTTHCQSPSIQMPRRLENNDVHGTNSPCVSLNRTPQWKDKGLFPSVPHNFRGPQTPDNIRTPMNNHRRTQNSGNIAVRTPLKSTNVRLSNIGIRTPVHAANNNNPRMSRFVPKIPIQNQTLQTSDANPLFDRSFQPSTSVHQQTDPSTSHCIKSASSTDVDNLWQDDQLDDLLSDIGEEMLTDF